ncbi:amino acid adenylation domain-containing protein [Coleofasciculus sp. FACHB-64]|uniref:non-ribosomal peptide synthetase family protein n=1 Tax=Cyanophyceae TaxID=3028117 RepID=UPI001683A8E8|nr:amino acid adenylation domain-containing protein [Coleofasciculus sp. FACHB-64]MBD2044454.1 amino acid adenylation domain-containing protein [Coleofasciculus sp. FACHB-64]
MQTINGFRLSLQQKYLWLLQQDSATYCAQCAILIKGNLKTRALKEAVQQIINRHEILRTIFHREPGIKIPIQVVSDRINITTWHSSNLTNCNPQEQEAKIEAVLQEERRSISTSEPTGSLLRASLITLSDDKHILIVTLPSLCADSWTLKNLVQEISQGYAASLRGEEIAEEEVVQYVQFSEWQNQLLEDEDDLTGKEYWNQQDFSNLANLKLPLEKKLLGLPANFELNSIECQIEPDLVAKITAIAQKYNISISAVLLACWKTVLWRLTRQPDIIVSTAFNGRKYEELEPALGLFAKFLPLRTHLEDSLRFSEIVQQVQQSVNDANNWQEYFCQENISTATLSGFPFGFEFEEQLNTYSTGDLSFSIYQQYVCCDRFKAKLSCVRRDESLSAKFDYDAGIIGIEAIQALAEQFHSLVESAANSPETAIGQLNILSDRSRHELLVEFNNTQTDYHQSKCIHQLFEEQVERTPENIAVVFENQQLTYRELNDRANKIAHHLQNLGVKPEVVVGICVERSLEMVMGMLGIFKAGGAYLPLDPAMPKERLALMLQDAQVPVLLTQKQFLEIPQHSAKVVCLDTDWETIEVESQNSIQKPSNLAYVIYTSGSTGTPKGVAIEHQQLLNYLNGIINRLDLPAGASYAIISTFAADLGHTVVFPALCTGGCLHIISQERATDPEALTNYFQKHPIDCLKIVPSHLSALLTASNPAHILPRKRLILGGEALTWNLIETIQKLASNCQIFNHYGPTEATVGVLTYQVAERVADGKADRISETVPLGRPIPNTQIYILDAHLQPVPIGVPGELYIGGAGLARGYLNQRELTAKKFIIDSFIERDEFSILRNELQDVPPNSKLKTQNSKLYKTGDLARYLPDGNIEFLGRIDDQVKIRGFRVELGEIEAVLSQFPRVRQSIVLLREDELGQRLVAYIVSNSALINDLRSFLKEKLPEYMVPSAFVVLKALPLTPNGKIDRSALPAPETIKPETDTFVAPRNSVEELLAGIWVPLLKLEKVGIYDNFFDLGGHSLLIPQLLAKVRETFQIELTLRDFFDAPTIADLGKNIEMKQGVIPFVSPASNLNLDAEAVLDPTIRPDSIPVELVTEPSCIFLTGATGFLGAFLLSELLQQTQADIYCLVRATNAESGKERLQNSLESYSLWDENFSSRIIPVMGELSKPLLGLSDEQFRDMASQIDVIYHNGALVNFTYPYSALKAANVLGTQEVLRLASLIKLKPVHFISSTNAVSPAGGSGVRVIREQDSINPEEVIDTGYAQSKWVAEKLATIARDRGIPVCIYRPGRISWHSQTGLCNKSDNTFRWVKGCIQLGSVPKRDAMVNLVPIDYASRAIAYLSRQKESLNKDFHIVNPYPAHWNQVINWVRSFGYPLREISYDQWHGELLEAAQKSSGNALSPLVDFMNQPTSQEPASTPAILQFDCQNTLDGLAGSSIVCPPLEAELFAPYFSYLIDNGLLDAPPVGEFAATTLNNHVLS